MYYILDKNGLDGSLQSSKFVRALLRERNELSFMVSETIVYLWKIEWSKYVKRAAHPLSKQVRYSDFFSRQQPRSSYSAVIHSAKFHAGFSGLQLQIRIYLDKSTFTSAIMCCSCHCDLDLHQTTFCLVTTLLHQESDGDQNRKQQFLMTLPSRSLVTCSFEGDQKEDITPEQFVSNDELFNSNGWHKANIQYHIFRLERYINNTDMPLLSLYIFSSSLKKFMLFFGCY